jgi:tRNA (guanine-N7-)-methyltransferase
LNIEKSIPHFKEVFERDAPVIVEIGFGNGETLAKMAQENPHFNYIGIEVHKSGVGHLMMLLAQNQLTNVRIYCHDAIDVLEQHIPDNSVSAVHLFFPDPWHKKKHHKRRIVRESFIRLLSHKLKHDGYFHAATDWEHYAQWIVALFEQNACFKNLSPTQTYCERPAYRPLTKFEQRGLRLGHGVWDILFAKI